MLDGSLSYDPDGDALDFRWSFTHQPDGSSVVLDEAESSYPLFRPSHAGLYVAQLIVNDGQLDSRPALTRIEVSRAACDLSDEHWRKLPVIIRDFRDSHPDFEYRIREEQGIVEPFLGEDGLPVYAHSGGRTYTTTGEENFNQWYRDVPGVNYTLHKTLEIERLPDSTIWQYDNSAFFPIDGEGFGNEGRQHNYHFTLEARLEFDYEGGEEFTFRGDDDLWVFINGSLAMDIGGVHGVIERSISLDEIADELGITPGNAYSFDLFFAERHTVESNFKFQTNINLECVSE
jgi:fibro-slime domain-containing protein